MKVDVSARWARASLTYWLYATAHGPIGVREEKVWIGFEALEGHMLVW